MSSISPGRGAPQRCQLILQRCVAIQLAKPGNAPDDFWMYDSGYLLFQGFLSANSQCWWVGSLGAACRALRYAGYVAPGLLLIAGDPCALEVVRSAYSRSVLKPPPSYLICGLGDIEDCIVTPAFQGQFTPLPEALCDVIMDITSQGQSATMENIRHNLVSKFPSMQSPSAEVVYDTLAQLMQERKIYQTARGYFIVTPERRRSRSHSRSSSRHRGTPDQDTESVSTRGMLLSTQEALHSLYGEISTIRDGDLTHQCIQTNLADVICGGNPNDKILYGRSGKRRSASFPAARSLERRGSGRLWGSGSASNNSSRPQRAASVRHLPPPPSRADSSSSTEYPTSTDSTSPKKVSLLSRLFRRSGRSKQGRGSIKTFSAQFPPTEWFNSKAVHLHCVATQTNSKESLQSHPSCLSTFYDGSEISHFKSERSLTLPRHRRHLSTESGLAPASPSQCSTSLPRSSLSANSKTALENYSPHRNGDIKLRESPGGSLRKREYSHSGHLMSTSGPSSLESTNRESMRTLRKDSKSGPSSLESQTSPAKRYPSSQTNSSGHSSLESHLSDRTLKPSPSHCNNQSGTGLSRAQSLVKVQSLQSSPKSLHKNRNRPQPIGTENTKDSRSSSPQGVPKLNPATPKKSVTSNNSPVKLKNDSPKRDIPMATVMTNSNSNNSITLKVTTNTTTQNGAGTNTKVYVQNSPARSVITFENGKITETTNGSNIFIINDERQMKTTSFPTEEPKTVISPITNGTTETNMDNNVVQKTENIQNEQYLANNDPIKETKFNKNVINDVSMNNNRKLSLQLGNNANTNNGLILKNQLKTPSETLSNPSTPAIHNNILMFDSIGNGDLTASTKSFDNLVGSIGNLRYYEKNTLASANSLLGSQNKLNSNCDLKSVDLLKKTSAFQTFNSKAISQSRMSSDSIANILAKPSENKSAIIVGSEPNLALKNQDGQHNNVKEINSSIEKLNIVESNIKQKRYSLSNDAKNDNNELYNFPSLSDLSFNFTSLAAQKILKGVSINSVDTLVELNMAANGATEKQNNCDVTVCTDFGLV